MPANIQPEKPDCEQESVWDYPRPPRLEAVTEHLRVIYNDVVIADSNSVFRVLETSHPPCYYIPQNDIKMMYLTQTKHQSYCEFKGNAGYYTVTVGDKSTINAAWFYSQPSAGFEAIANYISFYANYMDSCYVGDEKVQPQAGDFYGGWITSKIVGPFKGGAGTWGW
jgi:uncharacterized protein (DUF427 family)